MSAARLREAAEVLRERAERAGNPLAYPQPWGVKEPSNEEFDHVGIAAIVTTNPDDNGEVTDWIDVDCATYIATMHPGVGLALAVWLDDIAAGWMWDGEEPGVVDLDGDRLTLEASMDTHALAVADAILGGAK